MNTEKQVEVYCGECATPFFVDRDLWEHAHDTDTQLCPECAALLSPLRNGLSLTHLE